MQVSYNGLILHLSEFKKFDTKAILFVETTNIQGFHDELKQRNLESNIQDIQVTIWQTCNWKSKIHLETYSDLMNG